MSKAKIIWVSLGSLFLIGAVAVGVYLVFHNQNLARMAAPATTLSIVPGSQNKSPDDSFPLVVEMSTGANQSMGFDLVINFNPQIFQVTSISAGSAGSDFSVIRNNIDNTGGKILYSVFITDTTKALNGSGLMILNISATVKPGAVVGTYSFTFDSSTIVMGYQENQNVLMGTTPGSVVIVGATGEPTPTPTTTPTNTPTATAGATATPTPTATATSSGGTSFNSNTSTPVPTTQPLPVTGLSLPTIILGIAGFVGVMITFVIAI